MPSDEMWQLVNEKEEAILQIDLHELEEVLVKIWNGLEDKSSYQDIYLFFDSSLNSSFTLNEYKKNLASFIELIQITKVDCPFINILDASISREISETTFTSKII